MSSEGSITPWIEGVKQGDPAAARALWQRYFPRLVELAREKLRGAARRMADEEDVALSAMDSFCRAAQEGRFPDLTDRDGLWRLLLRMTARKVVDLTRHVRRQRRGGGRVRGESVLDGADAASARGGIAQVIGDTPTPEFAVMMAEECRRLLEKLADADLQSLALAKMEGYRNEEIAGQLGCSVRTVERRLRLIRAKWKEEQPP